jgi:hypothetical protein
LPSNSPHDHMILRVDLVDSHGRWTGRCLQTHPRCDQAIPFQLNNSLSAVRWTVVQAGTGVLAVYDMEEGQGRVTRDAGEAPAPDAQLRNGAAWVRQVRCCRYRFPPTGELGYRGFRGAVGLGYRSLYKRTLIVNFLIVKQNFLMEA